MKRIIFALYTLIIICLAVATVVETYTSTEFVRTSIYGSWWFALLWAVLAALGIVYFLKHRTKAWSSVALHASFVVILAGAFITHVSAKRAQVHLRQGAYINTCLLFDRNNEPHDAMLPFQMRLDSFAVHYHSGTDAAQDYTSQFTIIDNARETHGTVAMNHIFSYGAMRFCQASYDSDMLGATLSINSDPIGIPVTYTGYALLFLSLVLMLVDPHGAYRRLLRSPLLRKGALLALMLLTLGTSEGFAASQVGGKVLPKETAERFGELLVLHNDRICPLQTLAIDFTKKRYGAKSYQGMTAEQVFMNWIFWGDDWMDIDRSSLLRVFPCTEGGSTVWYAPTDALPGTLDAQHQQFVQLVFVLLREYAEAGEYAEMNEVIGKLLKYQQQNGGTSLPSTKQIAAERIYNNIPFATILFMVCLTMGLLMFVYTVIRICSNQGTAATNDHSVTARPRAIHRCAYAVMLLSFAALTYCEYLRWTISGTVPMTNGYETMLFVAWLVQIVALVLGRRFRIMLTFGFLMSGFFLLVSHISQMDPQITHTMPVLNSPLLSIHVSIIMLGFALLSLTFVCALTALVISVYNARLRKRTSSQTQPQTASRPESIVALHHLSLLFLYPALTMLGIGIFVGAIWANVSWGEYWGWDPKEVWALITFMVYAVALHSNSVPAMRRPMTYHVFMAVAFLTIIMTYFGVNYLLGGMHSYA